MLTRVPPRPAFANQISSPLRVGQLTPGYKERLATASPFRTFRYSNNVPRGNICRRSTLR
jgi:hypothetical protein